jgi:hypothetical protein
VYVRLSVEALKRKQEDLAEGQSSGFWLPQRQWNSSDIEWIIWLSEREALEQATVEFRDASRTELEAVLRRHGRIEVITPRMRRAVEEAVTEHRELEARLVRRAGVSRRTLAKEYERQAGSGSWTVEADEELVRWLWSGQGDRVGSHSKAEMRSRANELRKVGL